MCRLNKYLANLLFYYKNWKLKTNDLKTNLLNVTGNKNDISKPLKKQMKNFQVNVNNSFINQSKSLKYLGLIINQSNNYIDHTNQTINKLKFAYGGLKKLIHSKFLKPKFKITIYKQFLRPIMQYGCPIWLNENVISSHQVERLRLFERKMLRPVTNTFRNRNTYKYINNATLYKKANLKRIDAHLAKISIKFVDKCRESEFDYIREMANSNSEENLKYKKVAHLSDLSQRNILLEDGKLLLFHKGKINQNNMVYNTNQ